MFYSGTRKIVHLHPYRSLCVILNEIEEILTSESTPYKFPARNAAKMRVIVADRRYVCDYILKLPFVPEKVVKQIPSLTRDNQLCELAKVHEVEERIGNIRFRISVRLCASCLVFLNLQPCLVTYDFLHAIINWRTPFLFVLIAY